MKKITLLLVVLLTFVFVSANPVDVATAKKIAENYFKSESLEAMAFELTCKAEQENGISAYYYVFSVQPRGFIIISGEDNIIPILGYSCENNFVVEGMPANIAGWLDGYKKQVKYVIENNILATDEIRGEWEKYSVQNIEVSNDRAKGAVVTPLIATKWNQGAPYNNFCPGDGDTKAVTGCTATAMAQIMKYWNHPIQGAGSNTYTPPEVDCPYPIQYPQQSVNFANTTYDWDNMINEYPNASSGTQAQRDAVATLMYHCGVSVNMNYGPCGSGAWAISYDGAIEYCSENALPAYFYYENTLSGKVRDNYNENQWISMLKTDLDAGRPVLYVGYYPDGGGHSFVCDGYDNSNLFHFNFGWGGSSDGYFTVASPVGFTDDQNALFGIKPISGETPDLTVSPTSYNFSASGGTSSTISITSNQSWTISKNADWLTTSKTNGSNNDTFTMTATVNTSASSRNAIVTITGGGLTATVTVTQDPQEIPTYTIKATAHEHGTIAPNGNVSVNQGADETFVFTPDSGYKIQTVLVDEIPNGQAQENGDYTFTNVTENHTIEVFFTELTGIDESGSNPISIYPNPVKEILTIELEDANFAIEVVRIYDLLGRESMECRLSNGKVNVSALPTGVYLLKIGDYAVKFVKE
jgi:hypothetical protein